MRRQSECNGAEVMRQLRAAQLTGPLALACLPAAPAAPAAAEPVAPCAGAAHLSRHCAGVRPTMGAIVRHCVGISLARCSSFSSSSRVHSVFLMLGSSHSYLAARRGGRCDAGSTMRAAHECCVAAAARARCSAAAMLCCRLQGLIVLLREPAHRLPAAATRAGCHAARVQQHRQQQRRRRAPAGLALLGRLAHEQRGDAGPLVEAILHHRRLENLILRAQGRRAAVDAMLGAPVLPRRPRTPCACA